MRSASVSAEWVETRGPALVVGCWSGRARVEWKRLGLGRSLTPARRSGRVGSRRDPSDGQVSSVVGFAIPLLRRGAGGFIVSVVGHSYLISLLPLLLIMSSYLSTTPTVLAMRRAPVGEGCRPYLCQVSCTTTDTPIPAPDRLLASSRPRWRASCPRARGRDD
ncbi:hypothetical protein B296_00041501 [Ensete ventricosum]|uniref:Uncharacterized protein n=1 Tax=Ensete ventricosum TaxID=4639 RepID=A0A426X4D1_ENSVE|nr:hypothetical protein B296_00041501 [Ensete ventricosum]